MHQDSPSSLRNLSHINFNITGAVREADCGEAMAGWTAQLLLLQLPHFPIFGVSPDSGACPGNWGASFHFPSSPSLECIRINLTEGWNSVYLFSGRHHSAGAWIRRNPTDSRRISTEYLFQKAGFTNWRIKQAAFTINVFQQTSWINASFDTIWRGINKRRLPCGWHYHVHNWDMVREYLKPEWSNFKKFCSKVSLEHKYILTLY